MRIDRFFSLALLLAVTALAYGCRAHPGSIAMTLVGDGVHDADVKSRYKKLAGKGPEAADEMFGQRMATFVDTQREGRELLMYKVKGDLLDKSRFLVEVSDGEIVAVDRKVKNKDGVEDIVKLSHCRLPSARTRRAKRFRRRKVSSENARPPRGCGPDRQARPRRLRRRR